jgi:hypothetical protein
MVRAALRPSGPARRPFSCENNFARQITSDVNRARHFQNASLSHAATKDQSMFKKCGRLEIKRLATMTVLAAQPGVNIPVC